MGSWDFRTLNPVFTLFHTTLSRRHTYVCIVGASPYMSAFNSVRKVGYVIFVRMCESVFTLYAGQEVTGKPQVVDAGLRGEKHRAGNVIIHSRERLSVVQTEYPSNDGPSNQHHIQCLCISQHACTHSV